MTYLFDPPPTFQLPFSKGGDLYFGFIYKPLVVDENGDPILLNGQKQYQVANYPTGSTVQLLIETDDPALPVTVDADITGSMAVVWEDKAVADTIKKGKLWRVVLTFIDGLDQVICNGKTTRNDGT